MFNKKRCRQKLLIWHISFLHNGFMIIKNIANVFKLLCLVNFNIGSLPLSFYKCPTCIWTFPLWSFGCKFGSNSQGYNVFIIWRILLLSYFISEMKNTCQRLFAICWLFTVYRTFPAVYKPWVFLSTEDLFHLQNRLGNKDTGLQSDLTKFTQCCCGARLQAQSLDYPPGQSKGTERKPRSQRVPYS